MTAPIELTDVNKLKRTLEGNESAGFNLERYSNEQLGVFIKKEVLDEDYFESSENNESQYLDNGLKLISKNDVIIKGEEQMFSDEQTEKVFVKCEILDEESKSEKQYSDEEFKLLVHKEEILDDDYDEIENGRLPSSTYCDTCQKYFKSKHNLKQHVLIHTNERPHSCSVCEKSFTHKYNLNQHMVVHTNERPHPCTVCKKSFNFKCNLQRHILIHTNESPHSCSICKKNFTRKDLLNKHLLLHSKEPSHSCSTCNKRFFYKDKLKEHVLIHTNERPHSCLACKKSFITKSALNRHMKKSCQRTAVRKCHSKIE